MGKETPPFEEAWPELAARLGATLRRRRVSPWLADDIVQETGLRLFKMWDSVDPDLSPWGLSLTIAKNLLWDSTHRQAARELLVDPPERTTSYDVETAGIARLELKRVARALGKMSHSYRSVLLAELGGADVPSPSPAATKMLRMRARKRLNVILESASASCLATIGAARRWAFDAQQFVRRALPAMEASASATMVAIVGAVVVIVPNTASTSPAVIDPHRSTERPMLAMAELGAERVGFEANEQRASDSGRSESGTAATQPNEEVTRHEVSFGGGVGGDARVERRRQRSNELFKPECGVEPREEEIYFKCTFDSRGERYKVDGTVRVRVHRPVE
jgi:hypothetical protein